jgi:hypothetical protein
MMPSAKRGGMVPLGISSSCNTEQTYLLKGGLNVKRVTIAFIATLIVAGALPALAAFSLNVPLVAAVPAAPASSFPDGAVAKLDWNLTEGHTAQEPATATLVSDGKYLYVRFDVTQTAPLIGLDGGDNVAVDLWPNGETGDKYRFGVGLSGAHTTDSTTNTTGWESTESTHPGGYQVTMKIPMSAVGSANSARVQFSRWIASTGELQVWAHSAAASDVAQAGTLTISGSVGVTTDR